MGRLGKGSGGRLTQAVKVHIGPSRRSGEHSCPVCERLWQSSLLLLQRAHGVSLFSDHRMHPTSSPVVSRMLATGTGEDGRESVDGSAQTITTLNNSRACSGVEESPAAMGEWRSDRRGDAGGRSHKPACRRLRILVACEWTRKWHSRSAAPWVTEQPFSGSHCSPRMGRGLEKVS